MKAPQVHIVSPVNSLHLQYGQPLNLVGYAVDPQDGMLADVSNLLWSGPEGFIDVGPQVGLEGMNYTGAVDVSLQATNSQGLTGTQTVQVIIGDDLGDPLPSLSVLPGSVAFQAANGDNSPQSAAVGITNGGGLGALDWTASIAPGADWLQADLYSGTVPYTMTLSVDPVGLANDTIYQTTVTISSSDGKTVQVPVTFQTGAGLALDEPQTYLFLPLISAK